MAETALATAYVKIVPSFKGFETEMQKTIGSKSDSIGRESGGKFASGFKSVFGPAMAALSVGAVGSFFSSAISSASDLAEQGGAVNQVFGSAAGQVTKFAQAGAKGLGQSTVQILDAAKSFGIYGKAAGLAGSANAKFSTDFVGLATDLASFNNTTVDEALLALQSGLRGESEPLRKYGVLLDDATLRQEALRLGLVKTTDQALTPAQKVLAAQAAIYKQTATQQGDFTRTSGGLANQQRIMSAEITNAKTAIGQALLPAMKNLVTIIANKIVPAVQQFIDQFKKGKTWLNPVVDTIVGFVSFMIKYRDFLIPFVVFFGVMKTGMKIMNLYRITMEAVKAAQIAFNVAAAANPIGIVIVAIVALIAALVVFFTKTKTGRIIFAAMVEAFKVGFNFLKNLAIDFANFFIDALNLVIVSIDILIKAMNLIPGINIPEIKTIHEIKHGTTTSPTKKPSTATTTTGTPAATSQVKPGGISQNTTLIYNAAPNNSIDSHRDLKVAVDKTRQRSFR